MQELIKRDLLGVIEKRMADDKIIAIRGSRQTGKSTLLELISKDLQASGIKKDQVTFLTFEDPKILDDFVGDPRALLSSYIKDDSRHYFLLDEVQYDRGAGKRLKLVFDTMKNVKLVVTGSSSLEIAQVSRFLVGRVHLYDLFTLSFGEYLRYKDERLFRICSRNNGIFMSLLEGRPARRKAAVTSLSEINRMLNDYVVYGGYPEVVKQTNGEDKVEVLKNIYVTYIGRDVTGLLGIADSSAFRKVLSLISLQTGSLINYNELSGESHTYYKQLTAYIDALEETYIVKLLRPFSRNRRAELRKNPKAYMLDTGLRNYLENNFNNLDARGDAGHLVESFVFSELYRNLQPNQQLNFWRTLAKAEVDFVFTSGKTTVPVEVKFSGFKKPEVSRGMRSFIDAYKPKIAVVATRNFTGTVLVGRTRVFFIPVAFI